LEKSTGTTTNEVSPLLELPPELRNTIYHLVLTSNNGEYVEITLKVVKKQTALLRVCSQIRNEATQIFYATNTFLIADLLGQEKEINRFMKNAAANMKLVPRLVTQFKPPKLPSQITDTIVQIAPNARQATLIELIRAYAPVHTIVHNSVQQCGRRLVEAGVPYLRIAVASSQGEITVAAFNQ
jgi:translation elongation factor EF-G